MTGDPHIALTSYWKDSIYYANSNVGHREMLSTPFNGVSVFVRQSLATENVECLDPTTANCKVSRTSFETIFMDISLTQKQELPAYTRIQKQLKWCSYSTCALFENDCSTQLVSNKVSISPTPPTWKIFNELSNSNL